MLLAILSDSHGRFERTRRAVQLLESLGAQAFVHCGDIGSERVLDELVGRRAWFVIGNTDGAGSGLLRYAAQVSLPVPHGAPLRFEFDGRPMAVFHGHEREFGDALHYSKVGQTAELQRLIGAARYVFYGHTHIAADHRFGEVRFINPGALHRAATYTVATLDPDRGELRYWRVDDDEADGEPRPFEVAAQ